LFSSSLSSIQDGIPEMVGHRCLFTNIISW